MILFELGKEWGAVERGKETAAWEMALKAGEGVPSPSDRAEILELLAAGWKSSDPGRAQAILDRIEPSVTGAKKALREVRLWAKTDPAKAQQWAEAMPPSFPYERALALKEAAAQWKKSQPKAALGALEKAFQQVSSIPEGEKKNKLLADLILEAASLDRDLTLRWISLVPATSSRDSLYKEAGSSWAGEDPVQAMKAAREISESSLRLALVQKAADSAAKKPGKGKTEEPLYSALSSWGKGREVAKREEGQAVPFYQQALEEIERLKDPREKACLLSGLATDWAGIDEKKAREVAEKIGGQEFAEPYSYALLQIAAQYRKWSRKEAEASFAQTLSAAEKISDPSLRAQRLLQTAREWKTINAGKGKEVLSRALGDAGKGSGQQDAILLQVLLTQAGWEPDDTVSTAKRGSSPAMQARVLLEGAKVLKTRAIDDKTKTLDKALLLAQKEKNYRLMAEVAGAFFALVPQRGLEIQRQIEPRDLRIRTLRRMAHSAAVSPLKEEGRALLDQASEEAAKAEGTTEKLQLLREIAADWAAIDKERAKATYLKAYQVAEKEFLSLPKYPN
jgi:ribosomal protein L22